MCSKAAALTKRDEDRFMLIEAWSTVPTPEAVAALKPHLDNPVLKNDTLKALRIIACFAPLSRVQQIPMTFFAEKGQAALDKVFRKNAQTAYRWKSRSSQANFVFCKTVEERRG